MAIRTGFGLAFSISAPPVVFLGALVVACGGAPAPAPASAYGASGDPTIASGSDDASQDGQTLAQPMGTPGSNANGAPNAGGNGQVAGTGNSPAPQPSANGPAAAPPPKKTPEQARAQFSSECMKTSDLKGYCDCAWGVTQKTLSPDEVASDHTNAQKMAQLQAQVMQACAAQLPESAVKNGYLEGCERNEPQAMKPYCECLWPELRKSMSVAELASPDAVHAPKFATAVKAGANKCSPKLPEDVVKKSFVAGCSGGRQESEAFCACAWKELRSHMSLADIQSAGVGDHGEVDKMKTIINQSCGSLKPASPGAGGAGGAAGPTPSAPPPKSPTTR